MTKTLRELIELAKAGKKFKAKTINPVGISIDSEYFCKIINWGNDQILADWEYIEERVPREIFVNEYDNDDRWGNAHRSAEGAKKKKSPTRHFIATRKFIEVIDDNI